MRSSSVLHVRGQVAALESHPAAGLVDEVDRLVGEVAVGDVAVGQVGGVDQCLVGVPDPVVVLVAGPEPVEDLDRVRHRRLGDLDGLEAPLQGRVLLEVLAVLLERGGAHGLQLAPGQHRLEDAGGVDGALGGAGADQGVDLVDEEDDVAPGADLLEHLLEALLEVSAVPGPRHQGTEVERVEVPVGQGVGHLAGDDALGEPLDDGGLAHARLADEHRVVLGAPGQHLHHPLDLGEPADDRVELALPGELGVVAPELVEDGRTTRRRFAAAGRPAAPRRVRRSGRFFALDTRQQLDDGLTDLLQLGAQLLQHLGGDALAFADQPEEDVLGADVVVAQLQRLAERKLEDLLGAGGERDVAAGGLGALADDLDDLVADGFQVDAHALERSGGDALALVDQPEEDVLGADVVVVQEPGFLLGEHHHPPGPVGEPLEHSLPP